MTDSLHDSQPPNLDPHPDPRYQPLPVDCVTKADWLAALESGEYHQCRWTLTIPGMNQTCCLGVAPKLAGLEFSENRRFGILIDQFDRNITSEVAGQMIEGMTNAERAEAMWLNDRENYTFPEIAAHFRHRWNMSRP